MQNLYCVLLNFTRPIISITYSYSSATRFFRSLVFLIVSSSSSASLSDSEDKESCNTSMARSFRFRINTPPLLVSELDCPPTNTCPNTNRRAVPQFPVSKDRNTGAAMGEMGAILLLLLSFLLEPPQRRDCRPMYERLDQSTSMMQLDSNLCLRY